MNIGTQMEVILISWVHTSKLNSVQNHVLICLFFKGFQTVVPEDLSHPYHQCLSECCSWIWRFNVRFIILAIFFKELYPWGAQSQADTSMLYICFCSIHIGSNNDKFIPISSNPQEYVWGCLTRIILAFGVLILSHFTYTIRKVSEAQEPRQQSLTEEWVNW